MAVDKEELVRFQKEDSTLQKFKETKGTDTRKSYRTKNVEEFDTGYVIERMKWEIPESRF